MGKKAWLLIGGAAFALLITAATVVFAKTEGQMPAAAYSEERLVSEGYVLMAVEDGLGVFHGEELIETCEVNVAGLRAFDRELLEKGIEAASYEEVLRLLEDFNS